MGTSLPRAAGSPGSKECLRAALLHQKKGPPVQSRPDSAPEDVHPGNVTEAGTPHLPPAPKHSKKRLARDCALNLWHSCADASAALNTPLQASWIQRVGGPLRLGRNSAFLKSQRKPIAVITRNMSTQHLEQHKVVRVRNALKQCCQRAGSPAYLQLGKTESRGRGASCQTPPNAFVPEGKPDVQLSL